MNLFLLRRRANARADAFALLALALVCAFAFWPLLRGQTFYYGDLQLYFQPMATFWKSHLVQGRVPLWNAGILGGTPFVGSPQMWILYPSALLLLPFSAVAALSISTLLHFWLAGAFFYGWTRRGALGLSPISALLGAVAWMLCGFVVSKSQFPNMLQALAWIPAVLWAGEVVATRPGARATLVLALALALQLLAAHAQISLFSGYMLLIYGAYRWRVTPSRTSGQATGRTSGWRVVASFGGALMLAGWLTLGQTLPVIEALGATARQSLGVHQASRFVLVPKTILVLILPHFYGDPMRGVWNYPSPMNLWESACYLGIAPLGLAVVAFWRETRARFWGAWTFGFLWLSMGVMGGLYVLAYHGLPGIARFHDAGRFLVGFSLGGAVLAALGAQWLRLNVRHGARWAGLAFVATTINLGVYARGFYPTMPAEWAQAAPAAPWGEDELINSRQARVWSLRPDVLWSNFQPIEDMRPGDRANTKQFFANVPPNRHLLSGWLEETGYEPMFDRATWRRVRALDLDFGAGQFPRQLARQLSRNSVRVLQMTRFNPLPDTPSWTLIGTGAPMRDGRRIFYYRNEKCLPRARWQAGDGDGDGQWQRALIARETSSSIELNVPAGARQIELADTMRPGWSATWNEGSPLPIETTPEGWRRVNLPPAQVSRRVRFDYAPMPWKLGVFVSLCALGFVSAGWTATRQSSTPANGL